MKVIFFLSLSFFFSTHSLPFSTSLQKVLEVYKPPSNSRIMSLIEMSSFTGVAIESDSDAPTHAERARFPWSVGLEAVYLDMTLTINKEIHWL